MMMKAWRTVCCSRHDRTGSHRIDEQWIDERCVNAQTVPMSRFGQRRAVLAWRI
jgi:hypothetical protein